MKKSYYCEKIEKTLHFTPNSVKFCCSCAEGVGHYISDFSKFNYNDIETAKKRYIDMLKKGTLPRECKGCVDYKEKSIKEQIKDIFQKPQKKQIEHIIIDHFKQCDCDCTYCSQKPYFPDRDQKYEILPIIKELYAKNMIDVENLKVEFQGGNVSCLNEFEELMRVFNENGCDDFVILTNGIKYLPILEEIGNTYKSHLCISLDAGTRETFQKIKNVDAFDTVIANLKQLIEKSGITCCLKYVIIKGVNDNKQELIKFLETVKSIGQVRQIALEIDYNDTLLNREVKFQVPSHYYELFEMAEKFCESNDFTFTVYPHTKRMLEIGSNF